MSGPEDALSGRRILVIEDDALLAMELMEELEEIGAEPIGPMMSVSAALDAVQTYQQIDAALMNVNLRGELSFPVADKFVSERFPEIPRHPKPAHMPALIAALGELLRSSSLTSDPAPKSNVKFPA